MSEPVTFVNIVDVDPARQEEVIGVLAEGAETVMSRRPGFLSVTLLASLDRRRIVNIARWESAEAVRATQADPAAGEYAARVGALAQMAPGLYTVVGEFSA